MRPAPRSIQFTPRSLPSLFLALSLSLSLFLSLYPSSPLSPLVGASKRKKEERKKKVSKGYKARGAVSGGRSGSAQKTHSCASSAACQNDVRWRGRGGGGGVGGGGGGGGREGGGRGEEKI